MVPIAKTQPGGSRPSDMAQPGHRFTHVRRSATDMYGTTHSGLGALLLLMVALLHKMTAVLHSWSSHKVHHFWFHHHLYHIASKLGLKHAIAHVREVIHYVRSLLK